MEEENKYYKKYYTLKQLSKELDLSIYTLRTYIRSNELKIYKKGKKIFILDSDIETWIKGR